MGHCKLRLSKLPPTNRFVAEARIRVRYAETDAMGIVHHSSYIIYFEEGRSEYARQRGTPYSQFEQNGYYLTVTEVNARYVQPARYDQELKITTWIGEMKSRSLMFNYEISEMVAGNMLVTGYSRHICITTDGQVTRIPELWRGWA
jgi:acyl-CoA thioester hydrolase